MILTKKIFTIRQQRKLICNKLPDKIRGPSVSRLLLKHSERTRNKSELFYRNIMFGMKDIEYKKNHFSNARQEQTMKRKEQKEFLGGRRGKGDVQ